MKTSIVSRIVRAARAAVLALAGLLSLAPIAKAASIPSPAASSEHLRARTVNDLLDTLWADRWCRQKSARNVECALRLYLRPGLGDVECSKLTQAQVRAWHASLCDVPTIANRALFLGRKAWKELSPEGKNPFSGILPFPERVRERRFTDDERARFAASLGTLVTMAKGGVTEEMADALWSVRGTAGRKLEVLTLRRDQVDLVAEVAIIEVHKTDHEVSSKTIYLSGIMDVIRRRVAVCEQTGTPYLFPSRKSESGHVADVSRAFHKVCRHAGIVRTKDLCVHMLRADWASAACDEGEDFRVIQAALGHKNPKSTARYVKPSQSKVRKAAANVGKKLGRAPW